MPSTARPTLLVFDVNETLLDLTSLEPLFERVFGDGAVLREWFAQLILYSEALTLSGLYVPFGALGGGALRMVGETRGVAIGDGDVDALAEAVASMPALPDVAPALERLRAGGYRLATLTNSAPGPSPTPLERAGLAQLFERSFSVDEVGRFKPAPEAYRLVADASGLGTGELCLVACHLWDVLGAQAAGCTGALIERPGNAVMRAPGVPLPDLVAGDMGALADALLALPDGTPS